MAEMADEKRIEILRLLGESSMRQNQIAQADTYLDGIERERERLRNQLPASSAELRRLRELTHLEESRMMIAEMEVQRLDREEKKTLDNRARNASRLEECNALMVELEQSNG